MICFSVRPSFPFFGGIPQTQVSRLEQVDNPTSLENVESKASVAFIYLIALLTVELPHLQWLDEILEYCPGVKVLSFPCPFPHISDNLHPTARASRSVDCLSFSKPSFTRDSSLLQP